MITRTQTEAVGAVAGAGAEAGAAGVVAGAGAGSGNANRWRDGGRAWRAAEPEPSWAVVGSSTADGVGGAVELEEALRAFVAAVEVDGAEGDGQLVTKLGNMGGEESWRLSLGSGTAQCTCNSSCVCGGEGQSKGGQGVQDASAAVQCC